MDVDRDADPLISPLLLRMLGVGSALLREPSPHSVCYTFSLTQASHTQPAPMAPAGSVYTQEEKEAKPERLAALPP